MEEKATISCIAWIPRGYARKVPRRYEIDEKMIEEIKQNEMIIEEQKNNKIDAEDFGIENYNEESELPVFASEITMDKAKGGDDYPEYFETDSEEEKEDYTIKDTDAIIIAGKIEKNEFSTLEVYIYEDDKKNLFVHHDITLSAFPLAFEWLGVEPSSFEADATKKGNFCIIGTFLPEIEIWDLDILDVIEPTITLGGANDQKAQKKGPKGLKNKKNLKQDSHTDAVLTLSLNAFRKEILASGSADNSVKLWDISKNACVMTYNHHKDKVQNVKWNPYQEATILTASFDKNVAVFDPRQADQAISCTLPNDVESTIWDPFNEHQFGVSTEAGMIIGYDVRKITSPLYGTKAHLKATTSLMMSSGVKGLMATCSLDGHVRIWDNLTINDGIPKLVSDKPMKAGKLNTGAFYKELPWTLACGTNKGELAIWDTTSNSEVVGYFEGRQ